MRTQQSERTSRGVAAKDLNRPSAVASTLANAIFGKGRKQRVGVVWLSAAFVGGAASLPASEIDFPVAEEPTPVASVEERKDGAETVFLYQMKAEGATITGVRDRTSTALVIPATIDGVNVAKIGESAFEGMEKLESATWAPNAKCQIGKRAFAMCPALKQVSLPQKLAVIPEFAFAGCGALEAVFGGEKVHTVGERAFAGCKSLETLTFGSISSLGLGAFVGCEKLAKFDVVSPKKDALQLVDGLLLSKDGKTLVACPPGRGGEVVVPDGVVAIAKGAFQGGAVESVVLPQTLELIDSSAFESCSKLKSVVGAPKALETIGSRAFFYCFDLERFDWPENLQVIGKSAFAECDLTSAQIKSVRRVGENAFYNNAKLATVEPPSETREIEASAFARTALKSFKLPRDLETLQPGAFADAPLEKLEIEEGNAAFKIVDGALLSADGKKLYLAPLSPRTTWKVPDGVRVIVRSAFSNSKSLASVEIPEGVETIGEGAFFGCSSLEKLTIPASVREIDDKFYECAPVLAFKVAEGNANYRSVDGSLLSKDGKTLYRRGGYNTKRYVVPNGVERLAPYSCGGRHVAIELPSTLKRIDAYAFNGCSELTSLTIPASVERLDERFLSLPNLTSFEVAPENPVYKSESGALLSKDGKTFYLLVARKKNEKLRFDERFNGEAKGVEYVVPEGVEAIVGNAFANGDEITKVVFPQSLKIINKHAFSSSFHMTSVSIPAGVATIEPGAFSGCDLREVVLESSQANFPPEAFMLAGDRTKNEPTVRVDEKVLERETAELAARKAREDAFSWGRHERGAATITGVRDRNATTIEIPETIDGLPVQAIATEAFAGMTALKTARIPESVQTIEIKAFENCKALEKVEFIAPEKSRLREIGVSAFKGCSALKTFEAPDALSSVGAFAFAECSALETFKFGKYGARIVGGAFKDCVALRSVEFPEDSNASATYIMRDAFSGCDALVEFNAPKSLMGVDGQAFGSRSTPIKFNLHPESKLKNLNGTIVSADGKTLLAYFGAGSEELVIPEGVEWLGLSFKNAPITSVRLPKSLRRIGAGIFQECEKLERVEIPEDAALESIESSAFDGCKALKTVAWPKSLKTIGYGAFRKCESLESFVGATGVEKIDGYAFADCSSLATVELPSGLREIGASAFAETVVKSLKIPASVTTLGDAAFAIGELADLTVEEGNEAVKVVDGALLSKDGRTLYRVLAGLKLKSFKIPDGVQTIERAALGGNATLEEVEIPESVTTIKANAFYRCWSLKKIRIPAKVAELNVYAFDHCDSLESFEVAPENPTFKSENGALLSKDGKIFWKLVAVEREPSVAPYVLPPTEADDQQRETAAYKNPVYRVPDGVETIAANAFSDMWRTRNAFTEIVLPESVKTIGRNAFQHCSRLATLRVPANVETIEPAAFARCYALKTFEIAPESPTYYVADGTLINKKEKTVCDIVLDQKRAVWRIPEGVETLNATWVTVRFDIPEIVLPESLTKIAADGLAKSRNLTKITIPKNVREVEQGAFAYCPKLEEVVLKSANTKITNDAFVASVPNPFEPATPANVKIRVEPDEEDAAQTTETAPTPDAANNDAETPYDEALKTFDVRIADGEATILGTRSQEATLKIPEKIDGAPVTKIASKAFANNEFVKEIVFPSTLREIGADAFLGCVALEKISPLPAGLDFESVRVQRFFCGLGALQGVPVDPNNQDFKDVDGVLFDKNGSNLYFYPRVRKDEFYQVPDGVRRIGDMACRGNVYIKRVKFPWTLKTIDTAAFAECRSLEAAEFFPVVNSLRTIAYGAFSGCDALKSIKLPDGLNVIKTNAFVCRSLETVEFYPVTTDAKEARETLLKENGGGMLPGGMEIHNGAFRTPNLKSFETPETLGRFDPNAIQYEMGNLETGLLPNEEKNKRLIFKLSRTMEKFPSHAFNDGINIRVAFELDPAHERWKTVDGVIFSKDGKTLYRYPWSRPGGLEYDVPDGVETIEAYAFQHCGLRTVRTPKSLRKIANNAFYQCRRLETIELCEGLVELGGGFPGSLKNLKIPSTTRNDEFFVNAPVAQYFDGMEIEIAQNSVAFKTIDGAIFSKDGKTLYWVPPRVSSDYVVPDGVETIGPGAFYGRDALKTVRLPNGLKRVERGAFRKCAALKTVKIPASVVEIVEGAFGGGDGKTFEIEPGNKAVEFVGGRLIRKEDGKYLYQP